MIYVFGSINIDFVCRVGGFPKPGETILAADYRQVFGGKGANQAVAAARALGRADGVAMVGAVGRDALGDAAIANLASEGVDVRSIARLDAATGCAFIAVNEGGENTIVVASGANGRVTADIFPAANGASDVYVLQLETPIGEVAKVARLGKGRRATTILNLAPAPPTLDTAQLRDLLAATDVLVVNEHEVLQAAALLAARQNAGAEAAAREISAACEVAVFVTLGAQGAILCNGGETHRVPALPVEAVDTTGAGDTFVGVLAASLASGVTAAGAMKRAVTAASLACRRLGAQAAMPTAAEIDAGLM